MWNSPYFDGAALQKKVEEANKDPRLALLDEMARLEADYHFYGRCHHGCGVTLMMLAVLAAAAAAIGGMTGVLTPIHVAILSFVPALLALFATNLRFREKANWYYQKVNALGGLRRNVTYLLAPQSPVGLSDAVNHLNQIETQTEQNWEAKLAMDWSGLESTLRKAFESSAPKDGGGREQGGQAKQGTNGGQAHGGV